MKKKDIELKKIEYKSERIERLCSKVKKEASKKKVWWDRDLTILNNQTDKKPIIIRKALAFNKMLEEMPISIDKGELIVGKIPLNSVAGGRPFPEYANKGEKEKAASNSLSIKSVWGHIIPDYQKVLDKGILGIREEASNKLERAIEPSVETVNFYKSIIICCDSVIFLAKRYSKLANNLSNNEKYIEYKEELKHISNVCLEVPMKKPDSFYSALQSFWFIFMVFHSTLNFVPMGRFDQYMYPFLIKDLNEGKLTIIQAQELIECLWIKMNERTQKNKEDLEDHSDPYDWSLGKEREDEAFFPLNKDVAYYNQWYQTCVLGGINKDGSDATNILSYMCLEATKKLKLTQPLLYARVHENSPENFLKKIAELIQEGLSTPTIFNDKVRINSLTRVGIPLKDANNYAASGCFESLIPAKMEFRWSPIHSLKSLELVLNRGYDYLIGKKIGEDTGNLKEFQLFEELMEAVKIQLKRQIEKAIQTALKYYGAVYSIAPVPFLSSLISLCMEKGLDLTQGGAEYIVHALSLTGLANLVDSLMVIKELVYDNKEISLQKLNEILNNNFNNEEEFRQKAKNRVNKFGNDIDCVDNFMVEITNFFVETVENCTKDIKNIKFFCMIGTTPLYSIFGSGHLASAEGRKSREPLAANLCPNVGVAKSGVTAVIKSHTKCNFNTIPMGSELDIHINQKSIVGEDGIARLLAVIETFLNLGGSGLNISVNDVGTLLSAQKEPEKYQDLMIRLGGWQAYFVALDRKNQDYHIERIKHDL